MPELAKGDVLTTGRLTITVLRVRDDAEGYQQVWYRGLYGVTVGPTAKDDLEQWGYRKEG